MRSKENFDMDIKQAEDMILFHDGVLKDKKKSYSQEKIHYQMHRAKWVTRLEVLKRKCLEPDNSRRLYESFHM